jgi:hypothetical protein
MTLPLANCRWGIGETPYPHLNMGLEMRSRGRGVRIEGISFFILYDEMDFVNLVCNGKMGKFQNLN